MNAHDRIMDACNFMYKNQGYVDIHLIVKMVGIPEPVIKNVIMNHGFEETNIHGQFYKPRLSMPDSEKTMEEL